MTWSFKTAIFNNIRKLKLVHHYYLLFIQVSPFFPRVSFIEKDSVQNHALHIIVSSFFFSLKPFLHLFLTFMTLTL